MQKQDFQIGRCRFFYYGVMRSVMDFAGFMDYLFLFLQCRRIYGKVSFWKHGANKCLHETIKLFTVRIKLHAGRVIVSLQHFMHVGVLFVIICHFHNFMPSV